MIQKILESLGPWGPVFFGIGCLAPLIATIMENFDIAPPFGLSAIVTGLALGTLLGLAAKYRGTWI